MHGAAQGLEYLHGANLVHGDLKGVSVFPIRDQVHLFDFQQANVLMSNETPPRACLADFGFMTVVLNPGHKLSCSADFEGGTKTFMSPELLVPSKFGFKDAIPTPEADVYAFGLVTFQVCELDLVCRPFSLTSPRSSQANSHSVAPAIPSWDGL